MATQREAIERRLDAASGGVDGGAETPFVYRLAFGTRRPLPEIYPLGATLSVAAALLVEKARADAAAEAGAREPISMPTFLMARAQSGGVGAKLAEHVRCVTLAELSSVLASASRHAAASNAVAVFARAASLVPRSATAARCSWAASTPHPSRARA